MYENRTTLECWFNRYLLYEDGVVQKNAKTLLKWQQVLINHVKYQALMNLWKATIIRLNGLKDGDMGIAILSI